MTKSGAGALLLIVSLIGLATFLILDSWRDRDPEGFVRREEGGWVTRALEVGDQGFVSSGDGQEAIIAATKGAWDEIIKAELANDNRALAQIVLEGRASRVAEWEQKCRDLWQRLSSVATHAHKADHSGSAHRLCLDLRKQGTTVL